MRRAGPGITLWFAEPTFFLKPGFHLWLFGRHWWILPLPHRQKQLFP